MYWILPVTKGTSTVYERVVLYVQNQRGLIAPEGEGQKSGITTLAGTQDDSVLLQIVTSWWGMPGS